MKSARNLLWVCGAAVLGATGAAIGSSPAQGGGVAFEPDRPRWRWSEQNVELHDAVFSPDGEEIAVVRQFHVPDGMEVPGDSKSNGDLARGNERYADPQIVVVSIASRSVSVVDWGWNPCFSPNGQVIAYAHQLRPASGRRLLAETFAGNDIRSWNRLSGAREVIAVPEEGYLADPTFSPDGRSIAYVMSTAVNGTYGGGVGVGIVGLRDRAISVAYPPTKSDGYYHLIGPIAFFRGHVIAKRRLPMGGKSYLASAYKTDLLRLPDSAVLYSWGVLKPIERRQSSFSIVADRRILVYDGGWTSVGTGARPAPALHDRGVPSPDGRLVATPTGTGISVFEVETGRMVSTVLADGEPHVIRWSPDSRRIAAIVGRSANPDAFSRDELFIVNVPRS